MATATRVELNSIPLIAAAFDNWVVSMQITTGGVESYYANL